ncbi:AraC family transcriptional regulator [Jannaschia pagri]|uniref:AraC family transcriptional regulator n=1 Tax=Jannaschia pagri TaxID=2829797 RepID=A0ABQ4NI89_9RHOB|nr:MULTISPECIES: AraC family transcriptional regulator [unclassified Jannaschia]GIT89748.1 AraC family transcriptional regulator [Jannaschia sp. AI_61]GIT94144.1 AraC family transcriptional regulator [Jannaschia sp. AI_62]
MIALPIPLIVSLVLAFLLLRAWRQGDLPWPFLALIALCAVQTLLVALVQHYGIRSLLPLQPVLACAVPPLAWIVFQTASLRALAPRDALHLGPVVGCALAVSMAPQALDPLVPATYAAYAAAILWRLRGGAPALPLARLETGGQPRRLWQALAAALILSAVSDLVIVVAFTMGRGDLVPLVVSLSSSLALLAVGLLGLSRDLPGTPEPAEAQPAPEATEADTALVARLDALLAADQSYLQPDLTLARLARKLKVPAKQLSTAINRTTGQNVSRHVNGWRIRHACDLLDKGLSVTEAIYASGFNTKSNFNREFSRVTGATPKAWQARQALSDSI